MPLAALVVSALLAAVISACGGGADPAASDTAGREAAWLHVVADRGLDPAGDAIRVQASGEAPELTLTISVSPSAQRTYTFGDGLYGAEAYTFTDRAWARVDTADIRTMIAPLLSPRQTATVKLPVKPAGSYRVVVAADGLAAWGDST
jgi:hypothetical protein